MANAVVEILAPTGMTLTLSLFPIGSDTAAASGKTLTERTNAKGIYRATITEGLSGVHRAVAFSGSTPVTVTEVLLSDVATDHYASDAASNLICLGGVTLTGRDIGASVLLSSGTGTGQILLTSGKVTVGTNSDKAGYSLVIAYDPVKTAASQASVNAIPTTPLLAANYQEPPTAVDIASAVRSNLAVELSRIDVAISTRSTYAGGDTAGVTELLTRIPDATPGETGGLLLVGSSDSVSLSTSVVAIST